MRQHRVRAWFFPSATLAVRTDIFTTYSHHADYNWGGDFRELYFLVGSGGGLRSISVTTAIERAPFFPTARTAKK